MVVRRKGAGAAVVSAGVDRIRDLEIGKVFGAFRKGMQLGAMGLGA